MKTIGIFILSVLLSATCNFGQTRTITGKVIDQDYYPVDGARINLDTLLLATADTGGNFTLEIPIDTKSITIGWIGMEPKIIYLPADCTHLEVFLLVAAHYDFMSVRKIDRRRRKEFDKLPALHQTAFEKGIFKMAKPCYTSNFIPLKKN